MLQSPVPTSKRIFTISEAASHLGVSAKTLRRWEARLGPKSRRTKGNQRRFTRSQIVQLLKLTPKSGIKPRLSNLKSEIKNAERITIAATEDIAAEALKVESINPNSVYSTTFLLLLDTLTFFIKQVLKHHEHLREELLGLLIIARQELIQIFKLISVVRYTFTLFTEIAWELSKDVIKKPYQTIKK